MLVMDIFLYIQHPGLMDEVSSHVLQRVCLTQAHCLINLLHMFFNLFIRNRSAYNYMCVTCDLMWMYSVQLEVLLQMIAFGGLMVLWE